MRTQIRRLVVDSLKPRETSTIDLTKALCEVEGVNEVDLVVTEVDSRTETIKLTIRGSHVNYDGVMKIMSDHGATIRSVDEINVAKTPPPPSPK
ncbi:MAG: DUF211 domain-containing protein [Thaumarchaeota archaeon]|nr:DUF211 domain-containing protein [Nitrososphaerota archaeon]